MENAISAYKPRPRQFIIAREGFPFIGIAAGLTIFAWVLGFTVLSFIFLLLTLFVGFFFRNPERVAPEGDNLVIAPADGRVLGVDSDVLSPHLGKNSTKVSIFMSVMNVHINRFPASAKVRDIFYHPGKFFVASLDKASAHNERNVMVLEDERGREIVMVQIAGLVARRIVCYLKKGDVLEAGDRYGLIRFGSRVDLYFSSEIDIQVKAGDKVRSGETVLGRYV